MGTTATTMPFPTRIETFRASELDATGHAADRHHSGCMLQYREPLHLLRVPLTILVCGRPLKPKEVVTILITYCCKAVMLPFASPSGAALFTVIVKWPWLC
jgi:hypothetical protein